MNFINIKQNGQFETALPITLFSALSQKMSKLGFKTLDELMGKYIVTSANGQFSSDDSKDIITSKTLNAVILEANQSAKLIMNNKLLYIHVSHAGEAFVNENPIDMSKVTDYSVGYNQDSEEYKAIKWLEGKNTGSSSKSLLQMLYPEIKHPKLNIDSEINYPHDSSDFNRCLTFINSVPNSREKMQSSYIINNHSHWSEISKNWDVLTDKLNHNQTSEIYDFLKELNSKPKKPKI